MRVDVGDPHARPAEVEDFLEAAEELERQLEVESGVVVRQLTHMLRRQVEFRRLHDRFGSS